MICPKCHWPILCEPNDVDDEGKAVGDKVYVSCIECDWREVMTCEEFDKRFDKKKKDESMVFFITGACFHKIGSYGNKKYVDYLLGKTGSEDDLHLEKRTFGWTHTCEEAEKWILENAADISEGGSFTWMVIEGIRSGLYTHVAPVQQFFEFVGDWETDGHYEKLENWPEELEKYYDIGHIVKVLASIG